METGIVDGRLQVNDAKIYYKVVGEGTPLVLLHGNGEDHTSFSAQEKYFKKMYQVILIDSRGHGKSTMGKRDLNFKTMANDVRRVLVKLNIERTFILGFSDGANLALQFAVSYPEKLLGLIAVSGNINPKGMKTWFYHMVCIQYQVCRKLELCNNRYRRKRQLYGLMALHPQLIRSDLERITAPSLIVAGAHDIVREKHTLAIARFIPKAKVYIVPDANHISIYKKPETYNRIADNFMQRLIRQTVTP